jgi:8-oxo-dGTP diphosphatase
MSASTPKVAVSAVIFDEQDRVLLIERGRPPGQGLWTVPGGRLEFGEPLAAAVQREVMEETGLEVEVGELVEVVERMSRDDGAAEAPSYHYVILDYLARKRGGELRAGSDARAARFFFDHELDALPLTDGLRPVIARARLLARGQG